jgi:hypothetical protein
VRVTPETIEVRVMFILVDDFNGDVSQRGQDKGQRGKCKENLKKDFRYNQHFVIGINHTITIACAYIKSIKIQTKPKD